MIIMDKNKNYLKDYYEFGYCKVEKFLNSDALKKLNNEIDKLQKELNISDEVFDEDKSGKIKQIQYLHKKSHIFKELLELTSDLASSIIGHNNYTILNMQLFEKHPKISKPTRAHQDNAYFKLDPATAITIWIALDDINEDNGCIYYMPKSHLTPTHKHSRYHNNTTFRIRSGVPGLSLCLHEHPEEKDIPMITNAGDILIHNCNTIHRAGKNNTIFRRRAIGIVCIPNECVTDMILEKYHRDRLKEDIELQKIKDPNLYRKISKL